MAARGSSDMALTLVLSWYPSIDVDALACGFHESTSFEDLHPRILLASRRIAVAANLTQLVPAEPSPAAEASKDAAENHSRCCADYRLHASLSCWFPGMQSVFF